jgi:putative hydrolase of the HAD superfamily
VHWRRFEEGQISFHDQRRARVREFLALPFSDIEADLAFEPYRAAYEASWSLVTECRLFLERTANIPKVIVTNGDKAQQMSKVRVTGLHQHVVGVVTPEDCGFWKPHYEIFLAALSLLRQSPEHCLMIGDDWVRDIQPALQLGMQCFQVESGNPVMGLSSAIESVQLKQSDKK